MPAVDWITVTGEAADEFLQPGEVLGAGAVVGRGFAQRIDERGLGAFGELGHVDAQFARDRLHQLAPDSAPVVLDEVEIGRRDAHGPRQIGLPAAEHQPPLADAAACERGARHGDFSRPIRGFPRRRKKPFTDPTMILWICLQKSHSSQGPCCTLILPRRCF
jgi:hypothetical protein